MAIPNDPYFDRQWYLLNHGQTGGTPGVDIGFADVWPEYTGEDVVVGIFDDGFDLGHPDLLPNFVPLTEYDVDHRVPDASAKTLEDTHGTKVAGFAVAAANNGEGIAGVASDALFVPVRLLLKSPDPDRITTEIPTFLEQVWHGFYWQLGLGVDVSNNSWGAMWLSPFLQPEADAAAALADEGREGRDSLVVVAAGNGRGITQVAQYTTMAAMAETITVANIDADGRFHWTSTPGPGVFISAPGTDVITTDWQGDAGDSPSDISTIEDPDYADGPALTGTSYSAPLVTGVIALILEANPDLGGRDVQQILAASAWRPEGMTTWTRTDEGLATFNDQAFRGGLVAEALEAFRPPWDWQTTGGSHWNGGGHLVSHDYGFGLIDAHAAVRLAESWGRPAETFDTWDSVALAAPEGALPIPVGDPDGLTVMVEAPTDSAIRVEKALAQFVVNHPRPQDLTIRLTSPDGTISHLYQGLDRTLIETPEFQRVLERMDVGPEDVQSLLAEWLAPPGGAATVSSVQHWGESSGGAWTLTVVDQGAGAPGTLTDFDLTLLGEANTADDTYIFTDEFADLAAGDPTRGTLSESDGGIDVLNASAVTSDSRLDLRPGAVGSIDGHPVSIDAETWIEGAHGGDGADTLMGNDLGNLLYGWRGNDRIEGGPGYDTINGGDGVDAAVFSDPIESHDIFGARFNAFVSHGGDEDPFNFDTITGVEYLVFPDRTVLSPTAAPGDLIEGVDPFFYWSENEDVFESDIGPVEHYARYGWREGRDPNRLFDTDGYLAANPDVAADGVNPFDHYRTIGHTEGRQPSAWFDGVDYLARHPDVAATGIDPVTHALTMGIGEQRAVALPPDLLEG